MKKEYEEKLKLCKKLLKKESEGYMKGIFWDGLKLMEELIETKNTDVLCGLFDLFTEENENGVCETLESEIFENYTMEQVIEALSKKFPELVVNNEVRTEHFFGACMDEFDHLRKIFNHTQSPNSKKFLDEFEKTYGTDYPEEISILKKDMEAWPKK